jgi:hypothetical protein
MKSTIIWDITPFSPFNINRCFGGTYRLHLQERIISRARNQCESRWQAELCLFFDPEDGSEIFLRDVGWLSNGLSGVISQKIATLHNHRCEDLKYCIYNFCMIFTVSMIIFLKGINRVVSVMETQCVFFEVGIYILQMMNLRLDCEQIYLNSPGFPAHLLSCATEQIIRYVSRKQLHNKIPHRAVNTV